MEQLDLSAYYLSAIAIGVALVALLVALRHRKGDRQTITNGDLLDEVKKLFQDLESRLQTLGATENVLNEVKEIRQDLESKFAELRESHAASKIPEKAPSDLDTKLDKALSGLDFLATYFKIQNGINEYGSRIREVSYEFLSRIEDEFGILERQEIEGQAYALRSNMLLFSLMMAKIYLQTVGPRDSLPMVEDCIERAKRLV